MRKLDISRVLSSLSLSVKRASIAFGVGRCRLGVNRKKFKGVGRCRLGVKWGTSSGRRKTPKLPFKEDEIRALTLVHGKRKKNYINQLKAHYATQGFYC